MSPDEPSPQELLELGRVELKRGRMKQILKKGDHLGDNLGRVETLLEEQLLLLGGGQLLGSEVPVRRVHVQRAQLRRRRVPLKTNSVYLTILSRNADIGTRSTSN